LPSHGHGAAIKTPFGAMKQRSDAIAIATRPGPTTWSTRQTPRAGPAGVVRRRPPASAGGSCSYSTVPFTG
jgi:hypothetical protein